MVIFFFERFGAIRTSFTWSHCLLQTLGQSPDSIRLGEMNKRGFQQGAEGDIMAPPFTDLLV